MKAEVEIGPRPLVAADLSEVARIDAQYRDDVPLAYWEGVFRRFLGRRRGFPTFGFGVAGGGGLAGFLLAEVRAIEFGSEPCGWVFAVGIDEGAERRGIASALLGAARRRFAGAGVRQVRTMVRRRDVPLLSFFRASGFVGGPFVQLELELELDLEEEGTS